MFVNVNVALTMKGRGVDRAIAIHPSGEQECPRQNVVTLHHIVELQTQTSRCSWRSADISKSHPRWTMNEDVADLISWQSIR